MIAPPSLTISDLPNGSHLLVARLWLPRSVEEIFPFFADAGNLDALTPATLQFKIITPLPIRMEAGALIDYRLRLRGIPLRWRTRINTWQPPHRFVDEQLHGPYKQWLHEHRFEPLDGGTLCEDRVEYAVFCDFLANPLFVEPDIRRIFQFRQSKLAELFPPKT